MKRQLICLVLLLTLNVCNSRAQNIFKRFWNSSWDIKGGWGVNQIPGQNTTAPMVMFYRPTFAKDTSAIKDAIREKKYPIYEIYQSIYSSVTGLNNTLPDKGNVNGGSDNGPEWSKNAAFVFLMNIKELDELIR